jgi:hypothetical protein
MFAGAPLHYIWRYEVAVLQDVEAYLLWEIEKSERCDGRILVVCELSDGSLYQLGEFRVLVRGSRLFPCLATVAPAELWGSQYVYSDALQRGLSKPLTVLGFHQHVSS